MSDDHDTVSQLTPPMLESLIVCGRCCEDLYACGWDHWHIYVDDEHIHSTNAVGSKTVWCDRCEEYEEGRKTDCCDHLYPYCYLTIHPDGTTECYLCRNHQQEME